MGKKQKLKKTFLKGVKVISEVATVAVHIKSNSRLANGILILSKVLDSGIRIFRKDDSEYFNEWERLSIRPLGDYVCQLLDSHGLFVVENPESEDCKIVVADFDSFRIGWATYATWKSGPFVHPPSQVKEAKEV